MRLLSKSALAILVAKIEELAAVRVNLNLLTDKSVMKLAESLSLIQRNVKENKMMNRIHRASKQMNKLTDKDVARANKAWGIVGDKPNPITV